MNFDIKKFLKKLKLNEENISMVLGAFVIVVLGVLVVNYFKDKKGETSQEAVTTTTETQKAEIGKTHKVVKGETLWSVAEDAYGSGYNWSDIYTANNLTSQNIEVGQVLTIPQAEAKKPTVTKPLETIIAKATVTPIASATAAATATVKPAQTEKDNTKTYTVAKGDSLWKIAKAEYGNGYKWVEIARANKLKDPNVIHPGNVLTLPR